MITLKELAIKCNVSIATISNILNGKSNVSDETKTRILKIIEESGYKPNLIAKGLRASSIKTIALIIDDVTSFGSPEMIDGIMDVCEKNGYKVICSNLRIYSNKKFDESLKSAIDLMLSFKVDGIVYIAGYTKLVNYLPSDLEIPIVVAYAISQNKKIPSVSIDDKNSAIQLTEKLIQKGHTDIGLIMGSEDNIHSKLRLEGVKEVLEKYNIDYNSIIIGYGNWEFDSSYEVCKKIFNSDNLPSAIFCFNDLMAAGVYKYLDEIGKKPGVDVAVVGFDDRPMAKCMIPPLTTMHIQEYEIGKRACEILFKKLEGIELDENNIKIPCLLKERKSI